MYRGSPFGQACSCGRIFPNLTALGNHQNACKKYKKRLSFALAKVKDVLGNRKRRASSALGNVDGADPQAPMSPSVAEHDQSPEVYTSHCQPR